MGAAAIAREIDRRLRITFYLYERKLWLRLGSATCGVALRPKLRAPLTGETS
jgi:hypothetical protein